MLHKYIEIPLYRGILSLIISDNIKEIQTIIPEFDSEEIYAHAYYHKYKEKQCFSVIININNAGKKIKYGTIAHESVHICNMIFELRDIKIEFENDEPQAYLVEWVVDTVMKWLEDAKIFL
jgi:hypothetical protein